MALQKLKPVVDGPRLGNAKALTGAVDILTPGASGKTDRRDARSGVRPQRGVLAREHGFPRHPWKAKLRIGNPF